MHIYDDLFINSNNDLRFEYLSDQGSMLIICYDDFIDEMQPLLIGKIKKYSNRNCRFKCSRK